MIFGAIFGLLGTILLLFVFLRAIKRVLANEKIEKGFSIKYFIIGAVLITIGAMIIPR